MPAIKAKATYWLDSAKVEEIVSRAAQEPIQKCAMLVQREVRSGMKKGGRRRIGGKVKRIPSPPPEPPHAQSGNLRRSISIARVNEGRWLVGATANAWYGRLHEFGEGGMPKRPFVMPALKRAAKVFPHFFRDIL